MNQTLATGIVLTITTSLQLGLLWAFIRWVNVLFAPKPPKPALTYPAWFNQHDDQEYEEDEDSEFTEEELIAAYPLYGQNDDDMFGDEFEDELDRIRSREEGIPEIYINLHK